MKLKALGFHLTRNKRSERDKYWSHPDIAPKLEDLQDVSNFFTTRQAQAKEDEKTRQ